MVSPGLVTLCSYGAQMKMAFTPTSFNIESASSTSFHEGFVIPKSSLSAKGMPAITKISSVFLAIDSSFLSIP